MQKGIAYITHGEELLVFEEPDFPEAGTQVPGGTLESQELPAAGVMREAAGRRSSACRSSIRFLERSVEQELLPMARELGLDVTPWSPLKSGALSGKYRRENAGQVKADRAAFVTSALNEATYALVDELEVIAKAHGATVAAVALAWVLAQPGVTST